jgi:signal recognition particle subunit SRP72
LDSQKDEDLKLASDIFAKLREQLSDDKATLAGYVASHATASNDGSLDDEVNQLTSIAQLTRDLDVDSLESDGIPQSSNALAIAQLTRSRKRGAVDGTSVKPKRLRKSKLPKDFDESKKVDPERWLPMKDRSYYRPPKGKKKGKRGVDDRTQGGAVNEDLNIDAKTTSAATPTTGGANANKKKKGKGRK